MILVKINHPCSRVGHHNSVAVGSFSNVKTCHLIQINSNCSLTDPPKYKKITQSIYIIHNKNTNYNCVNFTTK
jgi:hypothetical protein